mmetsp:Transcript_40522/g.114794  ORF Transcript_40522/g.114794 Transcript_40522/m.114794 type:complete len:269 (+) Transcript_40522:864-1670(+)
MEKPPRVSAGHDGGEPTLLRLHVPCYAVPGLCVAGAVLLPLARHHPAAALHQHPHCPLHDGGQHLVLRLRQLQHHRLPPAPHHAMGSTAGFPPQVPGPHCHPRGLHGLRGRAPHSRRLDKNCVGHGPGILCCRQHAGYGHARGHNRRPPLHGEAVSGDAGLCVGCCVHFVDLHGPLTDSHTARGAAQGSEAEPLQEVHQHPGNRRVGVRPVHGLRDVPQGQRLHSHRKVADVLGGGRFLAGPQLLRALHNLRTVAALQELAVLLLHRG